MTQIQQNFLHLCLCNIMHGRGYRTTAHLYPQLIKQLDPRHSRIIYRQALDKAADMLTRYGAAC